LFSEEGDNVVFDHGDEFVGGTRQRYSNFRFPISDFRLFKKQTGCSAIWVVDGASVSGYHGLAQVALQNPEATAAEECLQAVEDCGIFMESVSHCFGQDVAGDIVHSRAEAADGYDYIAFVQRLFEGCEESVVIVSHGGAAVDG